MDNYYEIKTDLIPNLNNTKYTKSELDGNFQLKYIPLDNVLEEFINNSNKYGDKHGITNEMIKVFEVYKNIN